MRKVAALFLVASVLGSAGAVARAGDVLDETCGGLVGDWTTVHVTDGVEYDGEFHADWVHGRTAIAWTSRFWPAEGSGETTFAQGIIAWDPGTKTVREQATISDGTFATATFRKEGKFIILKRRGSTKDGTPFSLKIKSKLTADRWVTERIRSTADEGNSANADTACFTRVKENTGLDYRKLKGLEWMIGDWEAEFIVPEGGYFLGDCEPGDKVRMTHTCTWNDHKSNIHFRFRDAVNGELVHQGFEVTGVDPKSGKIKIWLFSIIGGYGEGEWTCDGKEWTLKWWGLPADGTKLEGVSHLVPTDKDTYTWQMTDLRRDGEEQPNTGIVTFRRVKK